jgi:hypothetical protein
MFFVMREETRDREREGLAVQVGARRIAEFVRTQQAFVAPRSHFRRVKGGTMERTEMNAKIDHLKSLGRDGVTRADWAVRSNPAKWAGIAAGAGFALGFGGRLLRRHARAHHVPQLVIIDSAC